MQSPSVVKRQLAAGIDVVNDGEQGRTDYTVHVIDRLTGFEGPSTPPLGTGEPEFPELAALLSQFASPFQHRPACSGPVAWKDFAAAEADIARAKAAMAAAGVAEYFMTSPSPGQIARYLKNRHYKTDEEYLFALADVMRREYRAIVEAGFVLQLDCPDLAMSYALYPGISLADYRKIIAVNVEALNHSIRELPADRMRMHVCWGSTLGPHHGDIPIKDIVDILLNGKPQAVSFPGANPRHGHEWKIWQDVKLPDEQDHHPRRDRLDLQLRRASRARGRPHRAVRAHRRPRKRHRRRRLRLRHLCRPRSGRQQDRLDEACGARGRRAARLEAIVVTVDSALWGFAALIGNGVPPVGLLGLRHITIRSGRNS